MIFRLFVFSFLFIFLSFFMQAQKNSKIYDVSGSYTYVIPESESLKSAKLNALNRAKSEALARKFGTIVSAVNSSIVESSESNSDYFSSIAGTEIKGEWLEDTKEPLFYTYCENDMFVIKVDVQGKAREISSSKINLDVKLLRNGTTDKYESLTGEFTNGDDMFLSFQTPIPGYLIVYLVDANKDANCLLPYANDNAAYFKVENNKKYILFSKKSDPENGRIVDEYVLSTDKNLEFNYMYILFSPNEFYKANDNFSQAGMPRQLHFDDFQKWLTKTRAADGDIQLILNTITIKK